jgi:hypothetical protein
VASVSGPLKAVSTSYCNYLSDSPANPDANGNRSVMYSRLRASHGETTVTTSSDVSVVT